MVHTYILYISIWYIPTVHPTSPKAHLSPASECTTIVKLNNDNIKKFIVK